MEGQLQKVSQVPEVLKLHEAPPAAAALEFQGLHYAPGIQQGFVSFALLAISCHCRSQALSHKDSSSTGRGTDKLLPRYRRLQTNARSA